MVAHHSYYAKKMMNKKNKLKLIFKLILTTCLLFFFFRRVDLKSLSETLLSMPLSFFVKAGLLYLAAYFVNTLKWFQLLENISLIKLFLFTLVAQYYTLVLPGGQVTGEAVKIYKLGKGRQDAEKIAASVIIDRITGFIGIMIVGISGLIRSETHQTKHMALWFATAAIILTMGLYLFQFRLFEQTVTKALIFIKQASDKTTILVDQCFRFIKAWKDYLKKPFVLLKSLLLGIIFQFICVCISMVLAKAFDIDISFSDWCWIFCVISVALYLPVTIGGIGVREGCFVLLLGYFGVSAEKALALSLSLFSLRVFVALIGGIVDFRMDYKRKEE